ncbi:hypothetical protein C8R44DRAFT_740724 [Mycena epipterygia]|nr:hypothetical protein C8R44DRAFT_740724 [Mycena epipterygia]
MLDRPVPSAVWIGHGAPLQLKPSAFVSDIDPISGNSGFRETGKMTGGINFGTCRGLNKSHRCRSFPSPFLGSSRPVAVIPSTKHHSPFPNHSNNFLPYTLSVPNEPPGSTSDIQETKSNDEARATIPPADDFSKTTPIFQLPLADETPALAVVLARKFRSSLIPGSSRPFSPFPHDMKKKKTLNGCQNSYAPLRAYLDKIANEDFHF